MRSNGSFNSQNSSIHYAFRRALSERCLLQVKYMNWIIQLRMQALKLNKVSRLQQRYMWLVKSLSNPCGRWFRISRVRGGWLFAGRMSLLITGLASGQSWVVLNGAVVPRSLPVAAKRNGALVFWVQVAWRVSGLRSVAIVIVISPDKCTVGERECVFGFKLFAPCLYWLWLVGVRSALFVQWSLC